MNRKPLVSLIWAMADNRIIGVNNRLPWKLPSDMQWFRKATMGKPIVMGRKTFESFGGKALPGRHNIVVTHDVNFHAEEISVAHSLEEAFETAGLVDEVMVIGGESFYKQTLAHADRLYVTHVHTNVEGDAWFPEFDESEWHEVSRIECQADEKNPFDHSFAILERNLKTD